MYIHVHVHTHVQDYERKLEELQEALNKQRAKKSALEDTDTGPAMGEWFSCTLYPTALDDRVSWVRVSLKTAQFSRKMAAL